MIEDVMTKRKRNNPRPKDEPIVILEKAEIVLEKEKSKTEKDYGKSEYS